MSLERILQALDAEAEHQIAEIERATQLEIEHIRTQAQVEAETVRQKHLDAGQASLQVERTRQLNRARQEAVQTVMSARETLLASALEATTRRLAVLSASELYPAYLRQLTQEGVDHLGAHNECCLHVRSQDVELMRQIVQELGFSATVIGDLAPENTTPNLPDNSLGGVVATSSDGRIRLVNTLAARLQRVAQLQRAQIAEIVFDQHQED